MQFSILGILAVVLELVRPVLVPLSLVILVDALLFAWVLAQRARLRVRPALRVSAIVGVAGGIGVALYLPIWTGARLDQLSSLVDFAFVAGAGVGMGVVIAMLVYPPVQLLMRRTA